MPKADDGLTKWERKGKMDAPAGVSDYREAFGKRGQHHGFKAPHGILSGLTSHLSDRIPGRRGSGHTLSTLRESINYFTIV